MVKFLVICKLPVYVCWSVLGGLSFCWSVHMLFACCLFTGQNPIFEPRIQILNYLKIPLVIGKQKAKSARQAATGKQ